MTQVVKHFLDPKTEIKTGTLGKNKVGRVGWGDPIIGMHAFNSSTGNDVFLDGKAQIRFTNQSKSEWYLFYFQIKRLKSSKEYLKN